MDVKSVSIRIEEAMPEKLGYVADFEGRSINSQVLVLIRKILKPLRKNMERFRETSAWMSM